MVLLQHSIQLMSIGNTCNINVVIYSRVEGQYVHSIRLNTYCSKMRKRDCQLITYFASFQLLQLGSYSDSPDGADIYTLYHNIFNITPKTGIIYVKKPRDLAKAADTETFTVKTKFGESIYFIVDMLGEARNPRQCSMYHVYSI